MKECEVGGREDKREYAPGATGGGRVGLVKFADLPSSSGFPHITNPIWPLGYVGMVVNPYCTDPPVNIPLHISNTFEVQGRLITLAYHFLTRLQPCYEYVTTLKVPL